MASERDAKPAGTCPNNSNEAFLGDLREISGQLAEQLTRLSLLASDNTNEAVSMRSEQTDIFRGQPRTSPAQVDFKDEAYRDVSDDIGRSHTEKLRGPMAESASQSSPPEDFVLPPSSLKKNAHSESTLGSKVPNSLYSLRISSRWRDGYSHTPPKDVRRSFGRQGKPPNLTYLIESLSAPDEPDSYEAALRVLLPGTQSNSEDASATKRLDDLRSTLGELRHLPYDNKFIFPMYAYRPSKDIGHIEAATSAVEAFAVSGIANDISIYDYNELFGCHRYTFSAHESTGHMRPMRPVTPRSWSEAPWSRLMSEQPADS